MCGIVGILGKSDVTGRIVDGLQRLEYRGYDSAGIAVANGAGIDVRRAVGKLENLRSALLADAPTGRVGIGHTRWATHGAASETNAHPHRVGCVTLVHNGIIENHGQFAPSSRRRVSGCGTAHYACHLASYWIEEIAGMPASKDYGLRIGRRDGGASSVAERV